MTDGILQPLHTGIAGAETQPLKIIPTPDGPVLHFLRPNFPLMPKFQENFGEIYFSEIFPGCIKAWKRHFIQNQLFAVPVGLIRIVLYDDRPESPSREKLVEVKLGRPDHYCLLRIPAGIWYGFQCLSEFPALICNCADRPHDPEECGKMPKDWPKIPWRWEKI